ncbi:hypothetical protein ACRAWD_29750 [Caulobacter segnis]
MVNIKSARDFDGMKVQAKYGVSAEGDGQSHSGVATSASGSTARRAGLVEL